jgi:hypothetical protein
MEKPLVTPSHTWLGQRLPAPTMLSDAVPVAAACTVYDSTGRPVAQGRTHRPTGDRSGRFFVSFGGDPFEVPAGLPAGRTPSRCYVVFLPAAGLDR